MIVSLIDMWGLTSQNTDDHLKHHYNSNKNTFEQEMTL